MAILRNQTGEVTISDKEFADHVAQGLQKTPKQLSSKYFYDEIGDELFVQITQLPEYYLTEAENEIFREQRDEILRSFNINDHACDIIELGAGDGHKAAFLLEPLQKKGNVRFRPIDISQNTLNIVVDRFNREVPGIELAPMQGEYFDVLSHLKGDRRKIVLFLGSNIGNLNQGQATSFIKQLSQTLKPGDMILLGLDLIKSSEIILPAYNDSKGVTSRFNLNLLARINNELGGNFDIISFEHLPEYDELEGEARSYLRSIKDQEVRIEALGKSFHFEEGELIHTEISRKYDKDRLLTIIAGSGLKLIKEFTDSRNLFTDFLLEKTHMSTD
ncbi:MAG: L-histidine N(alpha)-methyltransferase [Vicingaceae bacterium]